MFLSRLAQHRCSRIIHVEYRCPDCDKVFSCPANLASHRRWHKPRSDVAARKKTTKKPINNNNNYNDIVDNDDADSTARGGSVSPLSDDNNAMDLSSADSVPKVSVESEKEDIGALMTLNSPESRPFECASCGKGFRRRSYLRKHIIAVHQTQGVQPASLEQPVKCSEGSLECSQCPDRFSADFERTRHVIGIHSIRRLIQQREDVVKTEQRESAADPSASPFLCKFCPDSFANLSTLTGHVSKNHSVDSRQVAVITM